MFSTNIIVLLCFVCIIEKNSTSGGIPVNILETPTSVSIEYEDSTSTKSKEYEDSSSTENINLDDEVWEFMFGEYVTEEYGLISLPNLQKLFFNELNGFFTIRQLELYTNLINSKDNGIDLKLLKKMEPIIQYLLKGQSYNIDNKNDTSFTEDTFVIEIEKIPDFKDLFLGENNISEISELLDLIENWPIDYPMFEKIFKMLSVSQKVASIYEKFVVLDKDKNGVINPSNMNFVPTGVDVDEDTIESFKKYFMQGDTNSDGCLDFLEYLARVMDLQK